MKTAEITIAGLTFLAPQPFAEGHQCTAAEASVLNAALAENLKSNFAKRVKAWEEAKGGLGLGTEKDRKEMQEAFDAYAKSYVFSPRPASDPVSRAAHRIASDLVREALNAKGQRPGDLEEGKFEEFVTAVAQKPSVRGEAERRVAATKSIVAQTLDLDALA